MTEKQIFDALSRASQLRDEANKLLDQVMVALLQKSSDTGRKTDNLIGTLVAPEKGDIYTLPELANILKLSKSSIYKLCAEGKLPHHKPGGRKIIFYRHEVSQYLKSNSN